MHAMYNMHDPNKSVVEQSYASSSEYENKVLYQKLIDLSVGFFDIDTSGTRASNIVPLIDDQLTDGVYVLILEFFD